MPKNNISLLSNSVIILMACKIPISLTHLKTKTSHNSYIFHFYLDYLSKYDLIILEKTEKGNNVVITEKGRALLKVWVEINAMLGIKICLYL